MSSLAALGINLVRLLVAKIATIVAASGVLHGAALLAVNHCSGGLVRASFIG